MKTWSAALAGGAHENLRAHLLRADGQEDLCFVLWRPSTGRTRTTAVVSDLLLPLPGEREVHGNASFTSAYVLRAVAEAAARQMGIGLCHSHPGAGGWQNMSEPDFQAEARYSALSHELTGHPLLGMTIAGNGAWSARLWIGAGEGARPSECESVRVVGDTLSITYNDALRPRPALSDSQIRTAHAWGRTTQDMIARLRVAVVGAGSVGMVVIEALARTGIERIGVFDFDSVELVNLDRLHGATRLDAFLSRPKSFVAGRVMRSASTAPLARHEVYDLSVCDVGGLEALLDYDLVISCVDRPWPRSVLNTIAYADLIPVIDAGIRVFQKEDGTLRNAYWRSMVVRPGRPCLACTKQYDPGLVEAERDGSLDDPTYIAGLPRTSSLRRRENVAIFSAGAAAAVLQQFASYVAAPSGQGDPGPMMFSLRDHTLEREDVVCHLDCIFPQTVGDANHRLPPAGRHDAAARIRAERESVRRWVRIARRVDGWLDRLRTMLERVSRRASNRYEKL